MHKVAKEFDCYKYIKYQHTIKSAIWKEEESKWDIEVRTPNGTILQDKADVFINAGGVLKSAIRYPCLVNHR